MCCLLGLEANGVCALAPAKFTVETFSAGRGEVSVQVTNPDGDVEEVTAAASAVHWRVPLCEVVVLFRAYSNVCNMS